MNSRTQFLSFLLISLAFGQTALAAEVYTRGAAGACNAQDDAPIGASGPGLVNLNFSTAHWSCGLEVGPPLAHAQNITSVSLWVTDRSPTQEVFAALCFRTPGATEVCGTQVLSSGTGNGLLLTLPRPVGRFAVGTVAWIDVFVPNNTSGMPFALSGVDAWRVNN